VKPKLSKAAIQLREQIDDCYPNRDRRSDSGAYSDPKHRARKSDHNPDEKAWVHAYDCDRDLHPRSKPDDMPYLVNQLRLACKSKKENRISYIIFDGRICSSILNWKWRKYTGENKHTQHAHFSFKKEAANDGAFYQIPMLGGEE
jgi:hypothetical protein